MLSMNKVKTIIAFVFLTLIVSSKYCAQDVGFQRLYVADENQLINLANAPISDGGFYLTSVSLDADGINRINVTRHNVKGNITWSSEYEIDNVSYPIDARSFSTAVVEDDNLFITALSFDPLLGPRDEKIMLKLSANNGDLLWSNMVSDEVSTIHASTYPVTTFDTEDHVNVFSTQLNDVSYGIHHNRFDISNDLLLSQTYIPTDTSGNRLLGALVDAKTSVDSSHSILMISDSISQRNGLLKIDSLGNPEFSRNFSISQDSFPVSLFQLYSICSTPDTANAIAGAILDQINNTVVNIICKTDRAGNIVWSKIIDGSRAGLVAQVNDVITTSQNEILVSGKYINIAGGLIAGDFAIYFDLEGNIIRQIDHNSDNSFFVDINSGLILLWGELSNASDGSTFYSTSGLDLNGGFVGNYMIKMDSVGNAMCSDTFDFDLVTDFALITDTLNIEIGNFGVLDTLELRQETFNGYNTPVLSLADTTFCPQDPIVYQLIGAVPGATDYIWSTGDTTDRITVTEEGEFSVTVTVGERVCYVLCDTSNVSVLDFPEAQINTNLDFICEDDLIQLSGQLTAGAGARDFLWEDGTTDSQRDIFTAGNYSVTITDNCNNSAIANVSISADDFIVGFNLNIDRDASQLCDDGIIILTANSDSQANSYDWSSGETTQSIEVNTPGTYTVTVLDICNEEMEVSIDVSQEDLSPPELSITIASGVFDCENGVPLSVASTSTIPIREFLWSTGESNATITAVISGEYSVTVTDDCGTVSTASTTVNITEFSGLEFPNIFFPNSDTDINKSFGPYVECPDLIVANDYKLEIFNRWGNKVFESEMINNRWNGRVDNMGDLIQEDVYLFVYSYLDDSNIEVKGNGSVTLSR